MLSVAEALAAVLERSSALPPRATALAEALGLALAVDVIAGSDHPPFDKALMDGYAVRAADVGAGTSRLRVVEEVTAGRTPTRALGPGEAVAVTTGTPMPEGADAVVMIERARREGAFVVLDEPAGTAAGRNRMARGREMRGGEVVFRRGERLGPASLGVLAALGCDPATVHSRPRVAVVPTGDELVEPWESPGPAQIRNSNAATLRALVQSCGCEAEVLPIARDTPEALAAGLGLGLSADVLLVTGGVSAGNRDLVPEALAALGVANVFHKVRIKPGKPLWFGVGPPGAGGRPDGPLVFGLPGNPVSGVVSFLLFVRPALARLAGFSAAQDGTIAARLAVPFRHGGDRPTYHPSRLRPEAEGLPRVEPLAWSGSGDLLTVARADGFAVFPAGDGGHAEGEDVRFLPIPRGAGGLGPAGAS